MSASTVSKAYRSEGGRFWNTHVIDLLTPMISSGRKLEEEGVEDNGLEENSGDGQVRSTWWVSPGARSTLLVSLRARGTDIGP